MKINFGDYTYFDDSDTSTLTYQEYTRSEGDLSNIPTDNNGAYDALAILKNAIGKINPLLNADALFNKDDTFNVYDEGTNKLNIAMPPEKEAITKATPTGKRETGFRKLPLYKVETITPGEYSEEDKKKIKKYETNSYNSRSIANSLSKYRFDVNHYRSLINENRYMDAADYASKYHFNDPEKEKKFQNDIINLRNSARIRDDLYSKLDENQKQAFDFLDNVYKDGGLDRLKNNKYATEFNTFKNNFFINKNGDPDARYFYVTLEDNGGREFLGIDKLAKDSNRTTSNFYEKANLTEEYLKESGVEISHKDGYTTLVIDKANPLCNRLMIETVDFYNMSSYLSDYINYGTTDGNISYNQRGKDAADIFGLLGVIEKTKDIQNKFYSNKEKNSPLIKDYTSMVGPIFDYGFEQLKDDYKKGRITDAEFHDRYEKEYNYMKEAINSIGTGDTKIYSNYFNEEDTDETLVSVDDVNRRWLQMLVSSVDPKDITMHSFTSHGQIGILYTIKGIGIDKKEQEIGKDPEDLLKQKSYSIFIPGMFKNKVQEQMNSDTKLRAIQQTNSMQDYGYDYKCYDGSIVGVDKDGNFTLNDTVISKQEAIDYINNSITIEDTSANLKFKYMNKDGQIFDKDGYDKQAKAIAIYSVNERFPNIKLYDIDGNLIDLNSNDAIDRIFNMKGVGATVSNTYANKLQYELYNKYNEIYRMYEELMKPLKIYM